MIAEILEYLGINAPTFAKNIGVRYTRINDIQKGRTKKVNQEVADRIISKYSNFNMRWVLTGEGEMLNNIADIVQQANGDNNTQVAHNNNNSALEKTLSELAEMRKLLAEQIQINKKQNEKIIDLINKFKQ